MNGLSGEDSIDFKVLEQEMLAWDGEVDNRFGKDAQMTAIPGARA